MKSELESRNPRRLLFVFMPVCHESVEKSRFLRISLYTRAHRLQAASVGRRVRDLKPNCARSWAESKEADESMLWLELLREDSEIDAASLLQLHREVDKMM